MADHWQLVDELLARTDQADISGRALADQLGIDQSTVSQWRHHRASPRAVNAITWAPIVGLAFAVTNGEQVLACGESILPGLRALRQRTGQSQRDVARRAYTTPQNVNAREHNRYALSLRILTEHVTAGLGYEITLLETADV